jgi:hypothetical protein
VTLGSERADAHATGLAYLDLVAEDSTVQVTLDLPATDVASSLGLDPDHNGVITVDEVRARTPALGQWLGAALQIIADGSPCRIGAVQADLKKDVLLALQTSFACGPTIRTLDVHSAIGDAVGSGSSTFVQLRRHDASPDRTLLSGAETSHTFVLGSNESAWVTVGEFVRLGIHHIFTGYDHILFLLALLMIGGGLLRIVGLASAFTIAHTITLSLAATHTVVLPSRLTESAIAASIAYVAAENWIDARPPASGVPEPFGLRWRWLLTFAFGLVHGFGFASALAEKGLPAQHLPLALGSFNVGVELGQIAIISLAYPVLRRATGRSWYRPSGVRWASAAIFSIAIYWFVQRAFA